MADQPNIITDQTAKPEPKDLIGELVGEGKKYKTVEDLARGRLEADVHIARLETEAKDLREKATKAASIEDILEAVKANAASANDNPDTSKAPATEGLNAEQVAKIVAEQVTGLESRKNKASNLAKANAKMFELFGDKAQEVYQKQANTPELQTLLKQLAETSPDQFIAMFHKPTAPSQEKDTGGNKNTQALNLNQNLGIAAPGTQAFYAKLRKENPKQYFAPATQIKMHSDAMADPDRYFGRTK